MRKDEALIMIGCLSLALATFSEGMDFEQPSAV